MGLVIFWSEGLVKIVGIMDMAFVTAFFFHGHGYEGSVEDTDLVEKNEMFGTHLLGTQ